ncbi:MAG: restriction endonuclease subunit S, partial [Tissierellia bacterium]|nr:restriction endonuclease subunit S [Tissierellia bacterium]
MYKILDLIQEDIDQDRVEWKKLGDVGLFFGGLTGKSKKDFINGNKYYVTYTNVFNNNAVNLKCLEKVNIGSENQNKLMLGDVIFTASSENREEVGMSSVITSEVDELYLNSFCFYYRFNENIDILPGFSKYLFRDENIRKEIIKKANGVTRFNLSRTNLRKLKIPIPPLKTQEKIVEILDTFTNYIATLETELEKRSKQYEYYRDRLLREEYLKELTEKLFSFEKIELKKFRIGDVCVRQRGIKITAKKMKELDCEDGKIRIFAGGNTIANVKEKVLNKDDILNEPSIIVKSRGNIDFDFYEKPFTHKNEMWSYRIKEKDKIELKYLYYTLKSQKSYFIQRAISGKLPQISIDITENFRFFAPPLSIQQKIVEILDRFQALAE